LRTFRCLCFSFLHPYHNHKLDFCSFPCVFLSYKSSHLDYSCLTSHLNKFIFPVMSVFMNRCFFFDKSKQIAQPPLLPLLKIQLICPISSPHLFFTILRLHPLSLPFLSTHNSPSVLLLHHPMHVSLIIILQEQVRPLLNCNMTGLMLLVL
jgi:hypothetical protein